MLLKFIISLFILLIHEVFPVEISACSRNCKEMSLDETRMFLNKALNEGKDSVTFHGELKAGEKYTHEFAKHFMFVLEPQEFGWILKIKQTNREEDRSRLSPPLHFGPNPREIEGWHLRNSDNTGPNEAGEKNLNTPGLE